MSSEERKPNSTLPMQEAIGCEIFMMIYGFHIIYSGYTTTTDSSEEPSASLTKSSWVFGLRFCREVAWR